MSKDIDRLMELIAKHFTFDEKTYPELEDMDEKSRFIFALRHSALHLAKSTGKIAAASERADHGGEINTSELKTNIPKIFVTVLRLAEIVGMSAEGIVKAIEEKYGGRTDSTE